MFNLVDAIEAQITPDQVERISKSSGESPIKTRQAMSSGVLAILGGVIQRASSAVGAASLLSLLKAPAGSVNLASGLLGDRADQLTDAVAKTSGVSRPAAIGIMGALYPMVTGVLGREIIARKLDASGLAEMLRGQKSKLFGRPGLPSTFAGMLGIRETADIAHTDIAVNEVRPAVAAPVSERKPHVPAKRSWLPLALVVGAIGLGALLLARRSTVPAPAPIEEPRVEAPAAPERTGVTTLTAAEVGELNTHFTGKGVPDRVTLSNVVFDETSPNLVSGGDTIERVAVLMKEHPTTRVRIEGHANNASTAHANTALSVQRAAAVRKMLVDKGIDGKRVEVIGKGAEHADLPKHQRIDAIIIDR
jgi:OOP family OmpA-OmpF porin